MLFTLLVFVFTLGLVFMCLLPFLDGIPKITDIFSLMIGLANAQRMLEFLFVTTNMHLVVWLFSTLVLNILCVFGLNYEEIMEAFAHFGEESGAGSVETASSHVNPE